MKHPIDELLQRIYGVSDDDILLEFEKAEAEVTAEGEKTARGERVTGGDPGPDLEGFERFWQKLQEEHGKGGR